MYVSIKFETTSRFALLGCDAVIKGKFLVGILIGKKKDTRVF